MKILVHRQFKKQYTALRPGEQKKFKERRTLFLEDPFRPLLNNHALRGPYEGCRSINIGGDLRAVYRLIGEDIAYFIAIGTHDKLYIS